MENYVATTSPVEQKGGRGNPASLLCRAHNGGQLNPSFSRFASDFLDRAWADFEILMSQGADASNLHQLCRHPHFLPAAALRLSDVRRLLRVTDPEPVVHWLTISLPAWVKAVARCRAMWVSLLGQEEGVAHGTVYIQDRIRMVRETLPALNTTMDWLQFRHCDGMPESVVEVALAQATTPARVVNALWAGNDSLLQTLLLRTHNPDQVWPAPMIFKRALAAFRKRAPGKIGTLIHVAENNAGHAIFWPAANDHKAAVANLPVLMGFWAMTGIAMDWWGEPRRLRQVAEIYAFDRIWFNTAYNQGAKIAMAYDVQFQPDGGTL